MKASLRLPLALAAAHLAACHGEGPPAAPTPTGAAPASAQAPVQADRSAPPRAPVKLVINTYFGVNVVDPYQWMEDRKAPELAPWLTAQNSHARAYLDRLPARGAIARRLRELDVRTDKVRPIATTPGRTGERAFLTRCPAGCEAPKLFVREGPQGRERLLYDPTTDSGAGPGQASLELAEVSPDGAHVIIGTSPDGSEEGMLRVLEVATATFLPDRIDRINFAYFGYATWVDAKRFLYNRAPKLAPDAPRAEKIGTMRGRLHTLGADPELDPTLLGAGVNPRVPMQPGWASLTDAVPPYVIASVRHAADPQTDLYVAPIASLAAERTPWRRVAAYEDEVVDYAARGSDLYLLTRQGAPRYKVVRASLNRPEAPTTVVVPESDRVLRSVAAAKDALYVTATERGLGRIERLAWGQTKPIDVPLALEGSARIVSVDARRPGVEIEQASWLSSPRSYSFDGTGKPPVDTGRLPPSPIDISPFESTEVEATSADGTRVPLSIVTRQGLRRDGSASVFLKGYGAYGSSIDPSFDPHDVAIFERAVYAVCHVRGGGELGSEWYEQGKKGTKHHTWEDFIACAEYLVANKYTSPGKIAGFGYSAGGLCVGNAFTRRPDLFGAVIHHRGNGNPLRMTNPFMLAETGSTETKEGFEALFAMDPYHHIRDGARYPSALVTMSLNDTRVPHWHSTKLAARLQAASTSGRPVLLRVEGTGGHGIGATGAQALEEQADIIAFALAETGAP